jgi:predicted ATPase/serine/threonine protein kinase
VKVDLSEASPQRPIRLGRYDVTGLIRRGGMGTVYDAIEREHGKRVALKTLSDLDAESLLRFKYEFRSAADLAHPNLVALYELSCVDDLWFFTMERVDGVDFTQWVRGSHSAGETMVMPTAAETSVETLVDKAVSFPLPHPRVEPDATPPPSYEKLRDALGQLVRGVRAVHEAGLLHLDLKPGNVLVDRSGRVVVLDFGLVRAIHATTSRPHLKTSPVTIAGTPDWMAPEQFKGSPIGEATDWYAVGLMLYSALTGMPAFPAAAPSATWYARAHLPPVPPAHLLHGVPEDLSALAVALLNPEPAARPSGDTIASLMSPDGARRESAVKRISRSDLVGRETERAVLHDAFRRVVDRETVVVHVTGPSGVGKTALLESLRSDARRHGSALVLRGRCYERETVPYKAFDGMLDELAAWLMAHPNDRVLRHLPVWIVELSRVFPVLARVPAIGARAFASLRSSDVISVLESRRRALEALRELLSTLAEQHPVVLEIDDLQWADADSAALLLKLLEAPTPRRLLIAAAFRPTDTAVSSAIAPYLDLVRRLDARSDAHLVSIDVTALRVEDAVNLARETLTRLGVASDVLADKIAKESTGVPFFVLELARYAAQQRDDDDAPRSSRDISLETVLARRVKALPNEERQLLEVLAVANSPIPLSVSFAAAGIEAGGLRALWSLRGNQFVRCTGIGADDRIEILHDRMREAILGYVAASRIEDHHLRLGRALVHRNAADERAPFLFDAVRHLNAVAARLEPSERERTAELNLLAGKRARRAGAFSLAFDCFSAGSRLLDGDAWSTHYELAIALHGGAAESAYLSANWRALDEHVAVLKSHARSMLDQLVGWEAQIDGHIARLEYDSAVSTALEALHHLGVDLPPHPTTDEVGAELQRAMASLATVGVNGLQALPLADDPEVAAVMRIETRIGSATFFARPSLFPVLACRQIVMSVERGLSHVTPYALSVYGIVLNSIGMLKEAHEWGSVALALIERFPDRSLEARTRHVIHDLVCTWTVPLITTLESLENVVEIGRGTGDIEYAAYAAHAYVHNAFYAAMAIDELLEKATAFTKFMQQHEQMNALHVHVPFERILHNFAGSAPNPATLNGGGFDEVRALEAAAATGSRSAQCLVRLLMGIVRFHFGSVAEASEHLEAARPFLDGVVSTWHLPMFHQYAALAIHRLPADRRAALRAHADADLAALRALALAGPVNFGHRVALVEAAAARADGRLDTAAVAIGRAIADAETNGWYNDLALGHELASDIGFARGDVDAGEIHAQSAKAAYAEWGARAKAPPTT